MTGKYVFRSHEVPESKWPGGATKIIDSKNFELTPMAMLMIEIEPRGIREIHRHPDADEIQYYLSGQARMTGFNAVSNARTFNYGPGAR
ncbi:cupin domain-containing protein [Martelella soudanensis]|uniref:cupin domain-containing protein n=1 Tax=unclassified Martelella TaxID=2629616 RepID=UPI0015DE658E|nr:MULTISPECIES: cupin domain-containing protein [unclassified Martelella]